MTRCRNGDCSEPGRPYAYALGSRTTDLCDGCAASLTALGMALAPVERRIIDEPATVERRRFVAPWRRHLPARDESGVVMAR